MPQLLLSGFLGLSLGVWLAASLRVPVYLPYAACCQMLVCQLWRASTSTGRTTGLHVHEQECGGSSALAEDATCLLNGNNFFVWRHAKGVAT